MEGYEYLHVGTARDLAGVNRILYRALEMLPGILSFGTLIGLVVLSFVNPTLAAYFTIAFSAYWLFKTLYLSVHLRHNFRRLRHNMTIDWSERLLSMKSEHITHMVFFPFYQEGYEVIAESVEGILRASYDHKKIALVLAAEARAGDPALAIAQKIKDTYGDKFLDCIITVHPEHLPNEIPGKGSNLSYAAHEAGKHLIDAHRLDRESVLVSAFDVDTVVYPHYFSCLTWHFLVSEKPHKTSFQPVPLYNNNIWEAPTLSRVLAYSSTFWQMIQQERPERLATFSSHAMSFKALEEAGYWQRNIVSEDSRIFWNLFIRNDGDYTVVPLSYPVSMDANVGKNWWVTIKNLYRQHRRWTWGVENVPYIIFNCIQNPRIPLTKKLQSIFVQLEGFWSLSTNPLILFIIGWMPLIIGGPIFSASILSYKLPEIAKGFLTFAMVGLIFSAIMAMYLVPERPKRYGFMRSMLLVVQWVLVPFTMIVFSAVPGLETQGRLMIGRYMGFWVTPKDRVLERRTTVYGTTS